LQNTGLKLKNYFNLRKSNLLEWPMDFFNVSRVEPRFKILSLAWYQDPLLNY